MNFLFLFFACSDKTSDTASSIGDNISEFEVMDEFTKQLVGTFDSAEQAANNPSYYAVQLKACAVQSPEIGEAVLYVEQALVDTPNSPYRQRLYLLEQVDGTTVQSSIFELTAPSNAIGLCDEDSVGTFAASDAILKAGCEVMLSWDGEGFVGQTEAVSCLSDLNGSSYATSEVLTRPDRIESWDRGWFDNGSQAWGATEGAYIFLRRE